MKIGITGYRGRMGQAVIGELGTGQWDNLELAAASTRNLHPEYVPSEDFSVFTNPAELMEHCDCVIDFSTPDALADNLKAAMQAHTALVIGTTGLNENQESAIAEAAKEIPIVYAANMSVGVNLLLALVEQAAARLDPSWDIEIFETHHRNKVDAPSGTALALGHAARQGRGGGDFNTGTRTGKRKDGDIGFAASRGGDVVGEHSVTFYGAGERLELSHKATDRALFAKGALHAAAWIGGKDSGLYTMRDVLDI